MLEYARRRVKLFCISAATFPSVIVAIATIAKVEYQSMLTVPNATMNTRNAAANAATNITIAIRANDLVSPVSVKRELAIAGRLVDPVIPNVSDMAKTSRADDRADITKNFTAASFELGSFFLIAVRAYVGMLMSSHPT